MDTEEAQPEDLPPLGLRKLRDLDLKEPSTRGREAHVSAASGVARRGDFIYVIGDDEVFLAVFRASSPDPGELRRALSGDLPLDHDARKEHKPDLEVLTMLPPFPDHPHGALLGLGSGSAPGRDRGFMWPLAGDGELEGEAREVDLGPVYELLRRDMPELNIEGAAVMGGRLWLLQRGNSKLGANVVAELSLTDVMQSLRRDQRIDADELADVRTYDLGELDGVRLIFSDAAPLFEELLVFTASAEGSPDTDEEGKIHGSVVGTLDTGGKVRRLRTIDRRFKVEGVHASVDTGVIDFLFVCDQDDPGTPSPLLSATMPVDSGIE